MLQAEGLAYSHIGRPAHLAAAMPAAGASRNLPSQSGTSRSVPEETPSTRQSDRYRARRSATAGETPALLNPSPAPSPPPPRRPDSSEDERRAPRNRDARRTPALPDSTAAPRAKWW